MVLVSGCNELAREVFAVLCIELLRRVTGLVYSGLEEGQDETGDTSLFLCEELTPDGILCKYIIQPRHLAKDGSIPARRV